MQILVLCQIWEKYSVIAPNLYDVLSSVENKRKEKRVFFGDYPLTYPLNYPLFFFSVELSTEAFSNCSLFNLIGFLLGRSYLWFY